MVYDIVIPTLLKTETQWPDIQNPMVAPSQWVDLTTRLIMNYGRFHFKSYVCFFGSLGCSFCLGFTRVSKKNRGHTPIPSYSILFLGRLKTPFNVNVNVTSWCFPTRLHAAAQGLGEVLYPGGGLLCPLHPQLALRTPTLAVDWWMIYRALELKKSSECQNRMSEDCPICLIYECGYSNVINHPFLMVYTTHKNGD